MDFYYEDIFSRSRRYKGYRECHSEPDWHLIYGNETLDDKDQLLLVRTGTHSELLE